ncbi:MAG: alpha-amylase family glycosyl hydrolase, partial [Lactobacillus iners]|nr:alpha-amylase family glycosyl hydrolase [Lactobacillus iners]
TLYWNNHDMSRVATRFAKDEQQVKGLAMLMYLQRGIPVIYYGEELGLKNLHFDTAEPFNDITVDEFLASAIKAGKTKEQALEMVSKMHKLAARNVMPWDDSDNSGFTTGEPWNVGVPANADNVAGEENDNNSVLNFYRQLIDLKKTDLFTNGTYYLFDTNKYTYVYERDLEDEVGIVAVSLSSKKEMIELPIGNYDIKLKTGTCELVNNQLTLAPGSGVVLIKK